MAEYPLSPKSLGSLKGMSSSDATDYLHHTEEESDAAFLENFKSLKIPDDMLKAFDETYGIEAEMNSDNRDTQQYELLFKGSHYHATSYFYTLRSPGQKQRRFTIKLSHDGFIYTKRQGSPIQYDHAGFDHWKQLTPAIVEEMPFLASLKEKLNANIRFCYSTQKKRIDILFYDRTTQSNPALLPFLLVTFEKGGPTRWGALPLGTNFF